MDPISAASAPVPHSPPGAYPSKTDAAGRFKLPAKYQDHFRQLPDKSLFVTQLFGMTRIFTNGYWHRYLASIEPAADRKALKKFADHYGQDVEIDPQGRVTLPQLLRKELGLEDQNIVLSYSDDVITIHRQDQYDAEIAQVKVAVPAIFQRLETSGKDL